MAKSHLLSLPNIREHAGPRGHPDVGRARPITHSGYFQMHKSISLITQHGRLRIRCAELDTTRQDFVVKLLDGELSGDGGANRNGAGREEPDR